MVDADAVALWGTIGTWVAAGLAIVALIGVVGPLLAFHVAMTERNRALNSVYDQNGDYISKGIGYGKKIRFFRRVKVLALAPSDVLGEFAIPDTNKLWTFNKVKGTTCRASWARVCRLIECYTVQKDDAFPRGNHRWVISTSSRASQKGCVVPVLDRSKKGDLNIRQGCTRLPLSRYWVLVIGLLGRYSDQSKETRDRPSFLRYLEEERTVFSDSDAGSQSSASEETEDHEVSLQSVIGGFTGSFRIIKTTIISEGEIGLERTLLFERRNHAEIGISSNREFIPLGHQFWLAMGFLPLPTKAQNRPSVASLEDAYLDSDGSGDSSRNESEHSSNASASEISDGEELSDEGVADERAGKGNTLITPTPTSPHLASDLPIFKLSRVRDGPTTLRLAMEALQLMDVEILSFRRLMFQNNTLLAEHLRAHGKGGDFSVPKRDIQTLVCAFLEIPWNRWGYLIMDRNTDWWRGLLRGTMELLTPARQAICRQGFELSHQDVATKLQGLEISHWEGKEKVHYKQTKALYEASITVEEAMAQPRQIIIAVALLIITDQLFQEQVSSLIRSDEPRRSSTSKLLVDLKKGRASWTERSFEFRADMLLEGASDLGEAEIEPLDVTLVAFWAALRCRLWLTSPGSTPLIDFFRRLKETVYVR